MKPIQLRPSNRNRYPELAVITPLGTVFIGVGLTDDKGRPVVNVNVSPDKVPGAPAVQMITYPDDGRVRLVKLKTRNHGETLKKYPRTKGDQQ